MTTPADINTARLTQQLEINKLEPIVDGLQLQVNNGSTWSQITKEWNETNNRVNNTADILKNLNAQNNGLSDQPGFVSTKVKLTTNITQTNVMKGKLSTIQTTAFSNLNITSVTKNIAKTSSR